MYPFCITRLWQAINRCILGQPHKSSSCQAIVGYSGILRAVCRIGIQGIFITQYQSVALLAVMHITWCDLLAVNEPVLIDACVD